MRAGVHHARLGEALGQVRVVGRAVEPELDDAHAGERVVVAQFVHRVVEHPEVFGDEREPGELGAHGVEEVLTRALDPAAAHRVLGLAVDLPVPRERPEVIDPHEVGQLEAATQAGEPPGVAVGGHDVPPVERVAPELARLAEVVGRAPGLHDQPTGLVEVELALVGPDVRGVVSDVDRQVTEEPDAALTGRLADLAPLPVEEVEDGPPPVDGVGQLDRVPQPRRRRRGGGAPRATPTRRPRAADP